jgi:hypothetical protein
MVQRFYWLSVTLVTLMPGPVASAARCQTVEACVKEAAKTPRSFTPKLRPLLSRLSDVAKVEGMLRYRHKNPKLQTHVRGLLRTLAKSKHERSLRGDHLRLLASALETKLDRRTLLAYLQIMASASSGRRLLLRRLHRTEDRVSVSIATLLSWKKLAAKDHRRTRAVIWRQYLKDRRALNTRGVDHFLYNHCRDFADLLGDLIGQDVRKRQVINPRDLGNYRICSSKKMFANLLSWCQHSAFKVRDPARVGLLNTLLNTSDKSSQLGDRALIRRLVLVESKHKKPDRRISAIIALGRLLRFYSDRTAFRRVLKMARKDTDPRVRTNAYETLVYSTRGSKLSAKVRPIVKAALVAAKSHHASFVAARRVLEFSRTNPGWVKKTLRGWLRRLAKKHYFDVRWHRVIRFAGMRLEQLSKATYGFRPRNRNHRHPIGRCGTGRMRRAMALRKDLDMFGLKPQKATPKSPIKPVPKPSPAQLAKASRQTSERLWKARNRLPR